jgi:MFS family permease
LLATGTTTVPFARIISRWFDKRRGIALGIALAFTGIGGAVWSLGVQYLIGHVGWRNSFLVEGGFIAIIVLPVLLLAIRENPESMGFNIDGAPLDVTRLPAVPVEKTGMTLGEAAKTRTFWMVAIAFFIIPFPIQSILVLLVPMVISQGISPQTAAAIQASLWMSMVVGRLGSGWLVDRLFAPRVAAALVVPAIIGIAMLSVGVNGAAVFLAAMLVGVSNGSEGNILPYLTGRYFGLKHYTSIFGTFFSCYALGSGFGGPITSMLVSKMGGYHDPLWILLACLFVGAAVLLAVRAYPVMKAKTI